MLLYDFVIEIILEFIVNNLNLNLLIKNTKCIIHFQDYKDSISIKNYLPT